MSAWAVTRGAGVTMGSCMRHLPFHLEDGRGPKSITLMAEMAKHNSRVRSWGLQESSGGTMGRFAGNCLMLRPNRSEWRAAVTFVRCGEWEGHGFHPLLHSLGGLPLYPFNCFFSSLRKRQ